MIYFIDIFYMITTLKPSFWDHFFNFFEAAMIDGLTHQQSLQMTRILEPLETFDLTYSIGIKLLFLKYWSIGLPKTSI